MVQPPEVAEIDHVGWKVVVEAGEARKVWMSQCEVTPSIRARFGLQAALDYLVSEKLLNFAEAAASRPDVARELPMFVAQVRRIFSHEEIRTHLAELVPRLKDEAQADAAADEDEFERITPEEFAARLQRLSVVRQLLEAEQLGTS